MVKWPVPTSAMSSLFPVKRRGPCESIIVMPFTRAPISSSPTCGWKGIPMLCSSMLPKGDAVLSERLKPVVVAFARLFAITSWRALSASNPVAAMYMPLINARPFRWIHVLGPSIGTVSTTLDPRASGEGPRGRRMTG